MSAAANIIVVSADPVVSAALADQVREAGFTCVEKPGNAPCIVLSDADAPLPLAKAETLPVLYLAKNTAACPQPALAKPMRRADLIGALTQMALPSALPASLKLSSEWLLLPAERLLKQHDESRTVALTEKEVRLLACLLCSPERAASRERLLENVWGYGSDINTHTLETHIHRLRAKLKEVGGEGWIAATEAGYRINL